MCEIELSLGSGSDVVTACRISGVSNANYYTWRKRFSRMGRLEMANLKSLQKENDRLKKIVADWELDKLAFFETLVLVYEVVNGSTECIDIVTDHNTHVPQKPPQGSRFCMCLALYKPGCIGVQKSVCAAEQRLKAGA